MHYFIPWTGFTFLLCLFPYFKSPDDPVVIEKETPEGKAKMLMYRIQAGEVDKDGWYFAKSTPGGFSVRLPAKFNDYSVLVTERDGKEIKTYMVGTVTDKQVKYSVSAMPIATSKIQKLEDLPKEFAKESKVTAQKKLEINGAQGLEFRVENARSKAAFRLWKTRDSIFMLIADAYVDPPHWVDLHDSIVRFQESFKLPTDGKDIWAK